MSKILFFELEPWEKDWLSQNTELPNELEIISGALNADNLPKDNQAEVISVFVNSVINEAVLDYFPNLKFVVTRSTGYDHIDLALCQSRGIKIANVPSYGEDTVAEYTFALLLNLSRKVHQASERIRETGSFSLDGLRGFDLKGKTLGVIGTGRIGKNVIEIAKGFNLNIIAFDKFPDTVYAEKMSYQYLTLEEVLRQSDILTLHVPYIPENHHLINKDSLALMKKGVYLINTARGPLVETEALVKGLREGIIAGAGLDVLEEEGITKDELNFLSGGAHPGEHNLKIVLQNHALIDLPNVIITPHNAFNTNEALRRILETSVTNIKAFLSGAPINLIS